MHLSLSLSLSFQGSPEKRGEGRERKNKRLNWSKVKARDNVTRSLPARKISGKIYLFIYLFIYLLMVGGPRGPIERPPFSAARFAPPPTKVGKKICLAVLSQWKAAKKTKRLKD